MKRILLMFLALTILAGCSLSHPLVGRWKTSDKEGNHSVLYFKDDGTFEAIREGENLPGKWAYNEDLSPAQLKLVFEQKTVVTIVKLTEDRLLIEPRSEEEEMPKGFSDRAQRFLRQ